MGAVVPARCESRHHDGTVAGPLCPPACPACFHRGDEHDPRRYGVAARTGPGLLWWGKTAPVCHPRVSVAVSVLSFLQSAAKPQCVGNPALSMGACLCASCVPL